MRAMAEPLREAALAPGFLYTPQLITRDEEASLVAWLASTPGWNEVIFRGQRARRRAMSYGARYLAQGRQLIPAPPLPPALAGYRDRMIDAACAGLGRALVLAGQDKSDFTLSTALHYPAGAAIGWHTDNRVFGPTVLCLSLGTPARLQLRRTPVAGAPPPVLERLLAPRSLFVLAGEARSSWQHRVQPVPAERYSLTLRSLAR